MLRRLFTLAAAVSLVLCVGVGWLCAFSSEPGGGPAAYVVGRGWAATAEGHEAGRLTFQVVRGWPGPSGVWFHRGPLDPETEWPPVAVDWPCFPSGGRWTALTWAGGTVTTAVDRGGHPADLSRAGVDRLVADGWEPAVSDPMPAWALGGPAWAFVLATSAPAMLWLPLWLRRFVGTVRGGGRGLCPHCGYDLRATPGRCPRCGKVPPAPVGTV